MLAPVRSSTFLFGLGLLSIAVAGGGAAAHRRYWPREPVAQGVSIGDRRVPDDARRVLAWMYERREAALSRPVRFRHEQQLFESTLGAAGVTIDVEATLAEAEKIGHRGTVWKRLRDAAKARRGEIEVPLVWKVDEAKAKALRPVAEKCVTAARRGGVAQQRNVVALIRDKDMTHKLFEEIGPRYAERPGGYTRILKLGPRPGDNAPMARIEFV